MSETGASWDENKENGGDGMDVSESADLANGGANGVRRSSGRTTKKPCWLDGCVVDCDNGGREGANRRVQVKIQGQNKNDKQQRNAAQQVATKKKRARQFEEKRAVNVQFVAPEPEEVKVHFLSHQVPPLTSQQFRLAIKGSFGVRSDKTIDINSQNEDRAEFLNKELPLYSKNKTVDGQPVEKSDFLFTNGLRFAQEGDKISTIVVVNTEAVNARGYGGAEAGGRQYKFIEEAFDRKEGAKTVQNEVFVLAAMGDPARNVTLSNLFNWTLSQQQSSSINHQDFAHGSDSFEAGLWTFKFWAAQGISIFLPQGKTGLFWPSLIEHLKLREGAEVLELVVPTSTALGKIDVTVSVVFIPSTTRIYYIFGSSGHGSQLHKDDNKMQKAAAYTLALLIAGEPLTSEQNITMCEALVKIKGTSYINGDERDDLHAQKYTVKSGPRKGKIIMSNTELGAC